MLLRKAPITIQSVNLIIKRYLRNLCFLEESEFLRKNSSLKFNFLKHFLYKGSFITPEEETNLVLELDTYLQNKQYESNHWDDAIHGFRETERLNWNLENEEVINRIKNFAFLSMDKIFDRVHVLDLIDNGFIKPHVDSVKFCGNKIAGLSLLSNSVMRLTHVDDKRIQFLILLERRSLYVMKDTIRYDFQHEILKNEESVFCGNPVDKKRRISLIFRNEP